MLRSTPVGHVVSYDRMGDALGMHPLEQRHALQMAALRAGRAMLVTDNRTIEAVPRVGYRVVEAAEHIRLGRRRQQASTKQLERGRDVVGHVDMSALTPELRGVVDAMRQAFAAQLDFNARIDVRQRKLEDALTRIEQTTQRDRADIADVLDRLRKLEDRT
jgi:hypothetical protein